MSTPLLGQHQDRAKQINQLNQEVNFWQVEATSKLDNVTDNFQNFKIKQVGEKTYKTEVREARYFLQSLGVSQNNVSEPVRLLVKGLTGVEVEGSLPSYATQYTMCREMKLFPPANRLQKQ